MGSWRERVVLVEGLLDVSLFQYNDLRGYGARDLLLWVVSRGTFGRVDEAQEFYLELRPAY